MIAFHYPPEASSSGVQRTLTFSSYLRESDWTSVVLSSHPRAYTVKADAQLGDIPSDVVVARAFALDTQRHLAIRGRYPQIAALPDRWVSWWVGAVVAGWRLVRRYRPDVLWSTYPIATAHLAALTLHRLTRIPWIADFRDCMTEDGYPTSPRQWRSYRWIERKAVNAAARTVFTTEGAARMYRERYPSVRSSRFSVIANGYDEEIFAEAERERSATARNGPVVLLHSGILYPSERDPTFFFDALARLVAERRISPEKLQIVLRSTGHDEYHRKLIDERGIDELVLLAPRLGYREALQEMLEVDGLLVLQAANCNQQVPAKIYEYMRARKPIFALTDSTGDTANALRDASLGTIAPLDDANLIAENLLTFIADIENGTGRIASDAELAKHSRRSRTRALARLFDDVMVDGVA